MTTDDTPSTPADAGVPRTGSPEDEHPAGPPAAPRVDATADRAAQGHATADGSAPGDGPAVPDEGTLAAIATPASVRRAPRIGAFVRTGVLLGAVLGWLVAILAGGTTGEARTGVILISTVAVAGLGALLGAGAAALADRRSGRGVRPPAGPRGAR